MKQLTRASAWRMPLVAATSLALLAGGLAPAAHAATASSAASSGATNPVYVDLTPAAATNVQYDQAIPVTLNSRSVAYFANTGFQVVLNSKTKEVALEQIETRTGELLVSVSLTGHLDSLDRALTFDDSSKLYFFIEGSLNGEEVIVRVASPTRTTFSESSVVETITGVAALDPEVLAGFGAIGSSAIAIYHSMETGKFKAQRVNSASYALGTESELAFSDVDRVFNISPITLNIVSAREGGIDVSYFYGLSTVRSVEIPELGDDIELHVEGTLVIATDSDGTVALVTATGNSTPVLRKVVQLEARPIATAATLNVSTQLAEFQIVPASADKILRYAGADGAQRETIELSGLSLVPGSLTMTNLNHPAWAFLATVSGSTYRYGGYYHSAPRVTYVEITPPASDPSANTRFRSVSRGDATITDQWQYSLDGGISWAARGTAWSTAVADTGTTLKARPAVAAPLDGKAPSLRQEITENIVLPVMLSRDEPSIKLPAVGYTALWRVVATNSLGVTASAAQNITVPSGIDTSGLRVTLHPSPQRIDVAKTVTFTASASDSAATVQWQRSLDNGANWENITKNATKTSYTFSASLTSDKHLYRAAFTSEGTTVYTEAALLTVTIPAQTSVGAAPEGAVQVTTGSLDLDVSEYAHSHQWGRVASGDDVTLGSEYGFVFDEADGWYDEETGTAQLSWAGAAVFLPYAGMNGLHVTFANPLLAVASDGRATLTVDAAWNNGGGMEAGEFVDSKGFTRVIFATYTGVEISVDDSGAVNFTAEAEWANRPYTKPHIADDTLLYPASFPASLVDFMHDSLRGWFLKTGSEYDSEKVPSPLAATIMLGTAAASTEGAVLDPLNPLNDGRYPFADSLPVVITQPAAETAVAPGTAVTLTVSGTGYPAPTVQWQQHDGEAWGNISGAISSSLVLANAEAGTFLYRAVLTNRLGQVLSDVSQVDVAAIAPVITRQPSSLTVADGAQVTFVATSSGSPEPAVQWQSRVTGEDWTDLSGATDSTLVIERASAASSGTQYRAVFTNEAGTVESDAATLTVKSSTVKATIAKTAYGKSLVVKVTATNRDGSTVTVKLGTITRKATVVDGKATVTLPSNVAVGTHTVTVRFSGDALFANTTVTVKATVTKATTSTTLKVTKKPTTTAKGLATVTISSQTGAKVSGKVTLTLTKGKVTKKVTATVKNGKATIALPKSTRGTWSVKASYQASTNFASSAKTVKVKVVK